MHFEHLGQVGGAKGAVVLIGRNGRLIVHQFGKQFLGPAISDSGGNQLIAPPLEAADDQSLVMALSDEVRDIIQQGIYANLKLRRGVFL